MKVLVITTMFPNAAQPVHGVFVQRRVAAVAALCEALVVVPIPYFPLTGWLKRYRHRQQIPRRDTIAGLDVHYPRFLSIPRFCKPLDGLFLFLSLWWFTRRLKGRFDFDLIDAHLAYPDGFAGALLAKCLGKPLTITLRGHDINVVPHFRVRRRQVELALKSARRVMAVADALRRSAFALGCRPQDSETIPNAIESGIFFPVERGAARCKLGLPLDRRIIISVGGLVERKGQHLVIEALAQLKQRGFENLLYLIVGGGGDEGDYSGFLRAKIAACGLKEEVLLAGPQHNDILRYWYSAADVSCLASSKEGWANVLLESLACGTPVVATNVWGTPEVICSSEYGLLVERTPTAIASGLATALTRRWDTDCMVSYARSRTWQHVAQRVVENYALAVGADAA